MLKCDTLSTAGFPASSMSHSVRPSEGGRLAQRAAGVCQRDTRPDSILRGDVHGQQASGQ